MTGLGEVPGYRRFLTAATVSAFGSTITPLAVQLLVVNKLHRNSFALGLVSAAQWLPYLLFGLVAGALLDRRRRLPLQRWTDVGSAVVLGLIPLLTWLGGLTLPTLLAVMFCFGLFSLVNSVASQAFLPRLVPAPLLPAANARYDVGQASAETSGPALAGALVSWLGSALAVLVDAVSYLGSALLLSRVPACEPAPSTSTEPVRRQVAEGVRWVYGHRLLRALALGGHAWFICSAAGRVVMIAFAVRTLHLAPWLLGVAVAVGGVGGLIGSGFAARAGHRFGAGRTIIGSYLLIGVAFAVMATAPDWSVFTVGQFVLGLGMGGSNANEMGLRQQVTPDQLQGRMVATMRSMNRAMVVLFAPIGGYLGQVLGYRPVLVSAAVGFGLVAAGLSASPVRAARFVS